jgi:hypothetical protein
MFTGSIAATTSRASDLSLPWMPASAGDRFLVILSCDTTTAECVFPSGTATIPSATLAMLPAGTCLIQLYSIDADQQPAAGDWTVRARVATQAVDRAGNANLLYQTTLQ